MFPARADEDAMFHFLEFRAGKDRILLIHIISRSSAHSF